MEKTNVFQTLNNVNVSEFIEKKNGLSYLSWSYAWREAKKAFPDANYTVYERETAYGPVNYFTDGRTCWVKTGVTIEGLEHIEELPVMDARNRSIPLEKVTSFDVNKAIQRSLTKALARHGLGLYVYAGEDLPEEVQNTGKEKNAPEKDATGQKKAKESAQGVEVENPWEKKYRQVVQYWKNDKFKPVIRDMTLKTGKRNVKELTERELQSIIDVYQQSIHTWEDFNNDGKEKGNERGSTERAENGRRVPADQQ